MMDNKTIWDTNWKKSAEYATKSGGNRWAFYLIKQVLKNITLDDNYAIVDMGCGVGNKSAVLADIYRNNKIIGIDFSPEAIDFARRYYKEKNNLEFHCENVESISESLDIEVGMISAFEVLEHIDDWKSMLGKMCRIAQKYVLISTPTGRMRDYEKGLGHYRNFKKGEIEDAMQEYGYKKVKVLYAGFPFWSPLTRDMINISKKKQKEDASVDITYNKSIHDIIYFIYRYLTFNCIGDQFVGLFERK